jgi:hypothetical protein
MKNFKNLFLLLLAVSVFGLSSCLHIIEEATFRNNGSGEYKMMIDMSEMKGMMDMMKNMAPDSAAAGTEGADPMAAMEQDNSMAMLGQEMSKVSSTIKSVDGITDVIEISDTASFQYGYTFKFANVAALNRALKIINKEKYESKAEEIYKFNGKSFERLGAGDLSEELKKAMGEAGGDDEAGSMEMVKMFFADMSYKQIYHFPDRKVKKSSNAISELTDDNHTLTITLKPFNEEQQKKNPTISTKVKLK